MRQRAIRRLYEDPDFLDLNAEKTKRTKEACGEGLHMEVIELGYHDHPGLFCETLKRLGVVSDDVKGESKKMLTLSRAPDGSIRCRVAVPARETNALVDLLEELRALDQPAVDLGISE